MIEGIEQLIGSGVSKVVGYEPNGGFLVGNELRKNAKVLSPLMTRDAVLPILCLLSLARESGCKLSELTKTLPARFTASDRLQSFPTELSRKLLLDLSASFAVMDEFLAGLCGKMLRLDQTDGLRVFLEGDEIVHFRPSFIAPELRCYAESASQERSESLVQACLQRMRVRLDS